MAVTLGELARRLGAELSGDPEVRVRAVATLQDAGPDDVAFLANPKYREAARRSGAGALIVAPADRIDGRPCLVTANPYLAFARTVALLHPVEHPGGGVATGAFVDNAARLGAGVTVLPGACVDQGATVGPGSVLYPGVYVGRGARVGCDCVLHANAVVREGCVLGDRVILQPGAVIGSDGFGYAADGAAQVKIPQVGIVVLEDDVEVGAGSTIDRAALGETRVGRGTKIDNLVQVGHSARIGEDCLLVAQVGISGSTRLGDRVVLAGQVGLVGHIRLGDGVIVGAQSGVPGDLPDGAVVSGSPATDHREWLRIQGVVRRLPQLRQQVRDLERRLGELERAAAPGPGAQEEPP